MQVGHGELYGIDTEIETNGWLWDSKCNVTETIYINVYALFEKYRKTIHPKINTFLVQTAGYTDSILPESIYRGAIMSGWTGNEVLYAKEYIKLWDEIDSK